MILDVLVVLLVLVLALRGFRRGVVREVFSFAGWVLGAIAGISFVFDLAPWVSKTFQIPAAVAGLLSFVGIFLGVSIVVWLTGYLISGLIRLTVILRPFDKSFGLAIGGLEGLVLAAILVGVFAASPLFPQISKQLEQSYLSRPLSEQAGIFFGALRDRAQGLGPSAGEPDAGGPSATPSPSSSVSPEPG